MSKLKDVEFKQKSERLIENVSKIIFFEDEYVLNLNICSTLLFDKKITTSLKKSLTNVFNMLTSPFRTARFILLKFIQFVIHFFNLSSQLISKIIEKQVKEILHKKLKLFFAKKKILSLRKTAIDDRPQIIKETF